MSCKPILFNTQMVQAILAGRKKRQRLYVRSGEDRNSPEHLCKRLINALDEAPADGCWEWKRTKNCYGYGTITVNGKSMLAHRLAYILANGSQIDGLVVLHSCDNPACINPHHLRAGTQSDNMSECYERGRSSIKPISLKGEKNGASKLTEKEVIEIRRLIKSGRTQKAVAKQFGVSQSQVSNISTGRGWTHV